MSSNPQLDGVLSARPAGLRGTDYQPNPVNKGLQQSLQTSFAGLHTGFITRAGVGDYDYSVWTAVDCDLPCIQICASTAVSQGFGVTESALLPEGTPVQVYIPSERAGFGLIVSAGVLQSSYDDPPRAQYIIDPESGANADTEQAYREDRVTGQRLSARPSGSGRAYDLMPGAYCLNNSLGCGLGVLSAMSYLRASQRAKVETFFFDDSVRITSADYNNVNAAGETRIYSDYGYSTVETGVCSHHSELSGRLKTGQPAFQSVALSAADKQKGLQCGLRSDPVDAMPRRRLQTMAGHLAGGFQMFVQQPDPDTEVSRYGHKADDRGLAHFGIDGSGRVIIRSVNDIVFERHGVVAVPQRMRRPEDPKGTRTGPDADLVKAKTPFKFSDTDPKARTLQQRDYLWYCHASMLQRFSEFGSSDGKAGDWYVPGFADAKPPTDVYDASTGDKEEFSGFEARNCQIVLRRDGAITLRSHGGAEIQLVDGKIILSAPNGIELRSGKSVTTLAMDDVVIKAKNSVDVSATDKDVRIKAGANLQQYAGRGLLLESEGSDNHGLEAGVVGEDVNGGSIVLRASKGRIFSSAERVHIGADSDVYIETLAGAGGSIRMSTASLQCYSERQQLLSGPDAGFVSYGGNVMMIGATTTLAARRTAQAFQGQASAAWEWVGGASNPYDTWAAGMRQAYVRHRENTSWLGVYAPDYRRYMYFTHRTTDQYGVEVPRDRVYESSWVMEQGASESWREQKLNSTWPWPGKTYYEGPGLYLRLDSEQNVADSAANKPKADIVGHSGKIKPAGNFNEYRG